MDIYKRTRNWYVSKLRRAAWQFFREVGLKLAHKPGAKSSHQWWSLVKSAAGWSSNHQISDIDDAGMIAVSAAQRAEVLNAAFALQCSAPPADSLPERPDQLSSQFNFDQICEGDIVNCSLPTRKVAQLDDHDLPAHFPDVLNSFLFQYATSSTCPCPPMSFRLNGNCHISPIFKNIGDRCDPLRYRPIPYSSSDHFQSLGKVCSLTITEVFLSKNYIQDEQFGFLSHRSPFGSSCQS